MLFKVSSSGGDLNSLEPMPFRSVSHFDKLEKDLEYFIASEERSDLKSLQKQIGEEAHILTRTEIESVVRDTYSF